MQQETAVHFTNGVIWYDTLKYHMVHILTFVLLLGVQHTDLPDPVPHWLHCSWYRHVKV